MLVRQSIQRTVGHALQLRVGAGAVRFAHSKPLVKDVLVVGGGPAGLSLVSGLQHSPLTKNSDVALVDAQPIVDKFSHWAEKHAPELGVQIENRVISSTPKSVGYLDRIGAWEHVLKDRIMPYDEMKVWDGESDASIEFDGWSSESGIVATMIENSNLQQALYTSIERPEASIMHAGVDSITTSSKLGWPLVKSTDGTEIECRLLVGADGQQSPVRKFSGIESRGWDYNRFGVVGTLMSEYDNCRAVAYQRFLRTGPIAMSPLPDGRATLVWSTVPDRAQWLRKLEPQAMAAMVNAGMRLEMVDIDYLHTLDPANTQEIVDEVQWRLDQRPAEKLDQDDDGTVPVFVETVDPGSVAAFPLRMRHADSYIGDRVALVGDAAHATHPLTGQGLNMGQRDVQSLVAALETAMDRGLDIGSTLALEPYPRECYTNNHVILGVNDKSHKLYSTDCWPVVAVRSMGSKVVDNSSWIKDFAMSRAQ